jgi:hypothetical protein
VRLPSGWAETGWCVAALILGFVLPVVSGIWPFLVPVVRTLDVCSDGSMLSASYRPGHLMKN